MKITYLFGCVRSQGFPAVLVAKNLPANAGEVRDVDSIFGSGRSPGGKHGKPLRILAWRTVAGEFFIAARVI